MNVTEWALVILLGVAGALCIWAALTGGPGLDINRIKSEPAARHSVRVRGEVTQRIRPRAPGLAPMERDGGTAQRLPRREDLPWNQ